MIPLSLAQIAQITGGRLHGDAAHPVDAGALVSGEVVIDSRRVSAGGLFAAVAGERSDGHDFAAAAVAAGATAVLATRPVPAPSVLVADVPGALAALARFVVDALPSVRVAGITGSSGKTSTKDLAAQLVERLGPTIAPAGSYNNEFGHPLTVLRADASTRYLVLELSARGVGHIAQLCRIAPPRYGVVLNVGHAHAGEFGGLDQVARAKGELVEALPAAGGTACGRPAGGVAILNADDPRVLAMAARTQARIVTFGVQDPDASVRAADVRFAPVTLRLHGAHNVPNALAAAALAGELGLGLAGIADGLSTAVARSRWRMEVHRRADGVTVINDAYNANPESVRAAIDALAHLARDGRGFAVLGHMAELGDISRTSHEDIGEFAARVSASSGSGLAGLIAVGEEAAPLLAGARRVRSWPGEALAVPDGEAALDVLANRLKPGDVVLVKASRAAGLESVAADLLREADR